MLWANVDGGRVETVSNSTTAAATALGCSDNGSADAAHQAIVSRPRGNVRVQDLSCKQVTRRDRDPKTRQLQISANQRAAWPWL